MPHNSNNAEEDIYIRYYRLTQMTFVTLIFDPYVNGIENELSSYYETLWK